MRFTLLFFIRFAASANAWSLIEPSNESCKKRWELVNAMKRGEIEAKLLQFGLSSTGKISIQNIYRLSDDSNLGKKGDEIGIFVQEDLLGDRLFWIVLVNLNTKEAEILYDLQNQKKQNKTDMATPRKQSD